MFKLSKFQKAYLKRRGIPSYLLGDKRDGRLKLSTHHFLNDLRDLYRYIGKGPLNSVKMDPLKTSSTVRIKRSTQLGYLFKY